MPDTPEPTEPAAAPAQEPPAEETVSRSEYEKLLKKSRSWEDRAKANENAAPELERLRKESMTELERAVAEARVASRTETLREAGGKLVFAEVRAAAAGRPIDAAALVEGLDPSRFLTADGDPDTEAITAWVDKIAPIPENTSGVFPDLGQGQRGAPALNSDRMERELRSALGMS